MRRGSPQEAKFRVPIYSHHIVLQITRSVRVFLRLSAGVTRGPISAVEREPEQGPRRVKQLRRELSEKNKRLTQIHQELMRTREEFAQLRAKSVSTELDGVRPENVVWIFGYGRSGSTWLSNMMGELKGHSLWDEPMIGHLFGDFYYNLYHYTIDFGQFYHEHHGFIFGPGRKAWLRLIRSFFLDAVTARFPRIGSNDILVVKEPNGSIGAPLLMEALPESCMILLMRDPRDVVASILDAFSPGSWGFRAIGKEGTTDVSVELVVDEYLQNLNNARQAYDVHTGPKVLVKYEDLRADALDTMQCIYSTLGIHVAQQELVRVVEKHRWDKIPEENKGRGKFYRKATAGGWKKDLTAKQVELVERAAAPVLEEFYS